MSCACIHVHTTYMYINTQHTQQSAVFEELDLQADMAKLSAALALILATALINAKAMVNFNNLH